MTFAFDAAGRRRTLVEPSGGTFTVGYDLADRNTLVINPQSERTSWTYDAAGRATLQRLSNLVRVSMAYDAADRLVRLANINSTGTTITSFRDTWDGAGNRLARAEQDGTLVTWSYDSTYQLTRERRNGANSYDTTYSYDAAGNRLVKSDNSVRTTYTTDAANQLVKFVNNTGTTTLTYDACGSQRTEQVPSGGITTNTWDFENRLIRVALPTGVVNTFTYNGDGMRVQRQDSSGTLKAIWDGQKILEETDQNNVVQVIYTQSGEEFGNVVSQRRSGVSRYFLFDSLGSTSRLTDGSQNVTDSYLFKGFGESLLAAGPTTNPFQYVGQQGYYLDPDLGSSSLRARQYGPSIARFLSVDPSRFAGRGATLSGAYRYVSNNPLVAIDPSGLSPKPLPGPTPNPLPPAGQCTLSLCCRKAPIKCGLTKFFPCHCFVLLTDSAGNQTYYDGWAVTDPATWTMRCCMLNPVTGSGLVAGPGMKCFSGDYPTGAPVGLEQNEWDDPNTKCTHMGNGPCNDLENCLDDQFNWCNNLGPLLCYGGCRKKPNSNTIAFQFATACGTLLKPPAPPPPKPPTAGTGCPPNAGKPGGAPGYTGFTAPMYKSFCAVPGDPGPKPAPPAPPQPQAQLIPRTIVASLSSTFPTGTS